jgi:hypothetical protein
MKKEVNQRDGYRIVKRGKAESVAITIECPVCDCVSIDELDSISLSRSGACFDCENEIVDPNRKMWLEGWRPNAERVSEIVAKRLSSPHSRVHI